MRLFYLVIFLMASFLYSQGLNVYLTQSQIEDIIENTDLIENDLINTGNFWIGENVLDKVDLEKEEDKDYADYGVFEFGAESKITPKNMSIRVPLWYSYKRFNINISIPYYISKRMNYEKATKKASGLGDIVTSCAYSARSDSYHNRISLNVKLSTGDADNLVDGYLVPLGTGTIDYLITNNFTYFSEKFRLNSINSYRMNNHKKRIAEAVHPPTGTK